MARLDPLPAERGASFSSSATSFNSHKGSDACLALPKRDGSVSVRRPIEYEPANGHVPLAYGYRRLWLIFFVHFFSSMIIQGWYYYRYSIRCPWPCVSGASPLPYLDELRHTHPSIHCGSYRILPLWQSPMLLLCSGCGSGETNDIRASPDHMADRPCSLLERVVENDLGVK